MSNATKPIYNKLIRIRSRDRLPTSVSSSNFSVAYPNVQVLSKVVASVVKHVSFPNNFYNIDDNNNVFVWESGSVVIPIGNYDTTTLLTALNALVAGVFVFSQDPLTSRITVESLIGQVIIYSKNEGSTLSQVLGILEEVSVITTYTTDNLPQLEGVQHVYIASKFLSKGNNMIGANQAQEIPVVVMIPCNVPFGSIKHYETKHERLDIINYESEVDLQKIDIRLFDGNNNPLNLRGAEVEIILKIYYRVG
jgi:hypothetical protein